MRAVACLLALMFAGVAAYDERQSVVRIPEDGNALNEDAASCSSKDQVQTEAKETADTTATKKVDATAEEGAEGASEEHVETAVGVTGKLARADPRREGSFVDENDNSLETTRGRPEGPMYKNAKCCKKEENGKTIHKYFYKKVVENGKIFYKYPGDCPDPWTRGYPAVAYFTLGISNLLPRLGIANPDCPNGDEGVGNVDIAYDVHGMQGTTERYDPKACCKCDQALLGSGYVSVPMVVNIGGIRKAHANAKEACYYNVNHNDLCRYNGPLIDWKRDYGDC